MAATVSLWSVAGSFVYSVAVAVAIGLVVGHVNVRVRARSHDPVLSTAVSFAVPFVAFVPAEALHCSGVLAIVVTGVVTGYQSPARLRVQDRVTEAVNWRTVAFLLESGLFLLMGLSLKGLVDEAGETGPSVAHSILLGLAASTLVIVVRIAFAAPVVLGLRRQERRAAASLPRLETLRARLDTETPDDQVRPDKRERRQKRLRERLVRVAADLDFHLNEALGWRGGIVLGWAGMRGAITVAAAQTLPEDTPHRPQLILIAYVVAVTTLLCQGLSLPAVIRAANVPRDDQERLREEEQQLFAHLAAAGSAALAGPGLADDDGKPFDPDTVERARNANRDALAAGHRKPAGDGQQQYQQLCWLALDAQRTELGTARSRGTHSSSALAAAQRALDKEEARLQRMLDR
jgi:CPA1 family monovalent cation:H+ antiporter